MATKRIPLLDQERPRRQLGKSLTRGGKWRDVPVPALVVCPLCKSRLRIVKYKELYDGRYYKDEPLPCDTSIRFACETCGLRFTATVNALVRARTRVLLRKLVSYRADVNERGQPIDSLLSGAISEVKAMLERVLELEPLGSIRASMTGDVRAGVAVYLRSQNAALWELIGEEDAARVLDLAKQMIEGE